MAKMTSVKDLIADLNAGAKTELVERRLTEESVTNLVRGFEAGTPSIKVTPNEKGEHKLTIADMDVMDQYRDGSDAGRRQDHLLHRVRPPDW